MAAVVANKVKRQRSSRANQRAPPGGIQLEIDEHGRLREVVDVKARARAKARAAKMKPNPNAEYYQKVGEGRKQVLFRMSLVQYGDCNLTYCNLTTAK